jgi:hypothetical protein
MSGARSCCENEGRRACGTHADVFLDRFPNEENLPPAKWPDVVHALDEDTIHEALANRSAVVLNALRKFFGGQIRLFHR